MLPLLFLIVLPQLTSCGIISGILPSRKNNCGLNEVYRVYGHKCPLSCDTLKEKVCCNEVTYVPGCFCIDGFILETRDGPRKCVPIFECPRPGILRFKTGSISFPENVGVARIPVIRVNGSKGEVTVRWKADNLEPSLLTFPEGDNLQFIEIPIEDNQVWNPDVTFQVKLFDPSHKAEVSPEYDRIQVTIVDNDMKPGYLEMEKTDITIEESQGKVKVNVVRLGGKDGQINIRFKTVPGTARERSDFIPTTGKLVFEEGETVKPIYVTIVDDGVREGPETFQVQLFDPQAAPGVRNFKPLGTKLATIFLIKDDDMNPGYLELETGSLSVPESAGKARIKVVRLEGKDGQLKVRYKAVGSTASSNLDYEPTEGELVFEEGETSKFIDVPIIDDDLREKPESFRLELFDPSTGAGVINFRDRGSIHSVDVTIIDNDMKPGTLEFEKATFTTPEGSGSVNVCVIRVDGTDGEIQVRFKTVSRTALAKQDFKPRAGLLVFREGELRKCIVIQLVNDDLREPKEIFEIALENPTAASDVINFRGLGGRRATTVIITDDDMQPGALELEQSSYTVPENVGTIKVGVVRTGGSDGIIRVLFKTDPKTAQADQDFKPTSGELVFKEGEKVKYFSVKINNDKAREPTETFDVVLYDSSAAPDVINFRGLGGRRLATISIIDDDMNPGYLELETGRLSVPESAGKARIKVVRLEGTDGQLKVRYKAVGSTASSNLDYEPTEGELVFEEGETSKFIDVPIIDDDLREKPESFRLELFDPSTGAGVINFRDRGSIHSVDVTIIDNDMKPGFLELDRTTYTVPENAGTVQVGVVRVDGTEGDIRVHYKTVPKTAHSGQDFAPTNGLLVFKEGETVKYITVKITDDDVREPVESFDLVLHDTTAGPGVINFRGLGPKTTTTITVTDDDMRPGYLEMQQTSLFVPEDVGRVKVCVVRLDGSDGDIRVFYKTVPLTATEEEDFQPSRGSLLFKELETKKCFYVRIVNDNVREPAEVFEVVLTESTAGPGVINFKGLRARTKLTISITDDDMTPGELQLGESTYVTRENDGRVKIKVVRTGGSDGQVQVRYKTIGKTAQPKLDFVDISGTLVFSRGETIKYIEVPIIDDRTREPTESFEVVLFDPTPGEGVINFNGLGEKVTATVTIIDDDIIDDRTREPTESFEVVLFDPTSGEGVINFNVLGEKVTATVTIFDDDMSPGYFELEKPSYSVRENDGTLKIGVVRLDGSDGQVRVHYKTIPLTALDVVDFDPTSGELVFEDGEKLKYFDVNIRNDDVREPTKNFKVELFDSLAGPNVINFRGIGQRKFSTITIDDDDMTPGELQLGETTYVTRENDGRVKIKVVRTGGSDGQVQVRYKTIGKTAQPKLDFVDTSGTLVFSRGETIKYIEVPIIDDRTREPTENFEVLLIDPTPGEGVINFKGLGEKVTATVTIIDDDMSPGYFELEKPSYSVRENDGTLKIGVVRLDGSDGQVLVHYKTTPLTALDRVDFDPTSGELVFEDGEKLKYFDVNIRNDDVWEPSKNFRVELFDSLPGPNVINFRGIGQRKFSTITIDDDDMKPGILELGRPSYSIPESVGTVRVEVVRVDGSDGEVRVRLKTVSRSATAGLDFQPVDIELVFKNRETRKFVQIPIVDDDVREPSESFQVQLYDPSSNPGTINFRGLGPRSVSSITIDDNDVTPGELQLGETTYVTQENDGRVKIKVVRTGGSDGQVQVRYKTIGKTAQPKLDFVDISGTLVFSRGETIKYIEVPIIDDRTREPTESFEVLLFDPTPGEGVINFKGLGEKVTATVTIIDDDMSPGYFELEKPSYSVRENDGTLKIGVVRLDGSDGQVLVHYKTTPLTALDRVDFDPTSGELVFEDGEKLKYFDVNIRNDDVWEPTKNFRVELFDSLPGPNVINFRGIGQRKFSTITIDDDDMKPGFLELGRPSYSIPESVGTVRVEVVRVDGSDGEVRVRLKTVSRSATAGLDFQPMDIELVFKNRETRKFVQIPIVDDDVREPSESFQVQLYDPSSSPGTINFRGLGPRSVSSITIDDNDVHPGVLDFEQTNIAVPEDIGVVRVTIIRTGGEDGKLVARYKTIDGTARRGTDYTPVEGEVEFQEGEIRRTLTINIVDDNTKEPLENFEVQIFTDDPRARRSTTITVIDNDVNPGTFEFRERALSVVENDRQVVLTVQRTGGSDGLSTVTWRTIDGTAIEGFDYRGRRGSLTFNDGETEKSIAIEVIDDQIKERDEQFMVGLFDPSRGRIGLNSMVTVTIRDDDEGIPSNPVVSSNIEVFFTELIVRVGKGVNTARFHIERSGDLRPITVFLQTLDGSAKGGEDYRKTKGRIRFDRNEIRLTVEIKLVERRKQEFGKYFLVKLSNPSEGLVVPTHDTLTVIIDEEALRMNESPEVKTISEGDFDFDFTGRSGGSFTKTSSSSSSGTSVSETSGTSSRCNTCRPGTKGGFGNLPNPNIPSNRVPNIKTTGTSLDLSGTRTSNVNTGSPGDIGIKTSSTNMSFSVTGMKMPGFNTDLSRIPTINTPSVSNVPNVKIPTSRGDISRGSNMKVQNSRVEITRTSSSHTSGTNVGLPGIRIPGTGMGIPESSGVQNLGGNVGLRNLPGVRNPGSNLGLPNLPGVQNPGSNLGLPNPPGVQNPGSNLGLPNTGLERPSGSIDRGSNGRVDMTSSMSGNFQVPPAQLPPQSQNFEAGGFTKTTNCPPGMTFRICAPTCPLSCATLNRSTCQKKCINACFCPDGTVIDNPKSPAPRCVHPSTCRGSKRVAPPPGNTGVGGLLGGLGGLTGILG